MHVSHEVFINDIAAGLGCYYLLLCLMNWVAALWLWRKGPVTYFHFGLLPFTNVLLWLLVGVFFFILAPFTMIGWPPELPDFIKGGVNTLSGPVTLTLGALASLTILFLGRRFFVKPVVAWSGFNLALLAMGLSMTDPTFAEIVRKPDNVPIVGMSFHRLEEVSPGVCPTAGMDQFRSAHSIIAAVTIGL